MYVAEILAAKGSEVATIAPDRPIVEAIALLTERSIGALVVSATGSSIDGVLSERDIVRGLAGSADPQAVLAAEVRTLMSAQVRTCTGTDRIESLRAQMTDRRIRHLPVEDDDGRLCGIVSIGDVVKSRVHELEAEHEQLVEYVRAGQ